MTGELWSVVEVAAFFDVSESRARHILADNEIERVIGYPADRVRAIKRPGQGARTDLSTFGISDRESDLRHPPPAPHVAHD